MKIKYLAIALLCSMLVSTPLMAKDKDKHKPLVVKSEIDKATPATSTDNEGEVDKSTARTKGETTLGDISVVKEIDKSTPILARDAASGLPTGKRQHKPVSVTAPIDKSTPILMKTRDAASGLPTGKREHSKLDPDSDDDSVTNEACDTVDNDCDTDTSDDSGNSKRAAYMKLGDIKGEAMDAAEKTSLDAAGDTESRAVDAYMKLGDIKGEATDSAVDTSGDGADDDCDGNDKNSTKEQAEACVDGHVTVLK